MTLGGNMISKILEGSVVAIGDDNYTPEVNPAIENAVNAWEGSEQMLAESVAADINSEILLAYETFELAATLGAAKVVAEGSGPDGAMMVMENAFIDFFKKIAEKLKEIGNWIVSIFRRIFKKTKENAEKKEASTAVAYLEDKKTGSDGLTASEKITQLKETAKSDPNPEKREAAKNTLDKLRVVRYMDGEKKASEISTAATANASRYESQVNYMKGFVGSGNGVNNYAKELLDSQEDYIKYYSKTHFGKELDSTARVKLEMKKVWGCAGDDKAEITYNPKDLADFVNWYLNTFKCGLKYEKASTDINKSCQKAAKEIEKLASSWDKDTSDRAAKVQKIVDNDKLSNSKAADQVAKTQDYTKDSINTNKSAYVRKLVVAYNGLSSYTTAVLSEHISLATATFNTYLSVSRQLGGEYAAQAKVDSRAAKNIRKAGLKEGLDFDTFLECEDLGFDVTEESFDDDDLEGCSEGLNYSGSGMTSAFSDYIRSMV